MPNQPPDADIPFLMLQFWHSNLILHPYNKKRILRYSLFLLFNTFNSLNYFSNSIQQHTYTSEIVGEFDANIQRNQITQISPIQFTFK